MAVFTFVTLCSSAKKHEKGIILVCGSKVINPKNQNVVDRTGKKKNKHISTNLIDSQLSQFFIQYNVYIKRQIEIMLVVFLSDRHTCLFFLTFIQTLQHREKVYLNKSLKHLLAVTKRS